MKKARVILFILLFALTAYSQNKDDYGIKSGTAVSSITWTKALQNDPKVQSFYGFDFGGFINFNLSYGFSIVAELHFIKKGFKYPVEITTPEHPEGTGKFFTTESSANYISPSLSLRWTFHKHTFEPYIFGGVRLDFIAGINDGYWNYYYNLFNEMDLGISTGAGIQTHKLIGIGTGLEFRFSPNITNSYSDSFEQIRNKSFEILLSIYY